VHLTNDKGLNNVMQPAVAVVFYQHPTMQELVYIEQYKANKGKLTEGKPATEESLAGLCEMFLPFLKSQRAYIPDNIVAYAPLREFIAWWKPAGTHRLFFSKKMGIKSGLAPLPPLLFAVKRKEILVWALKENKRPTPESIVMAAPFYNIYREGRVCTGNATLPDSASSSSISKWEDVFFLSEFSGDLTPHLKKGITPKQLWTKLIGGKVKKFPVQHLVEWGRVQEIIKYFTGSTNE